MGQKFSEPRKQKATFVRFKWTPSREAYLKRLSGVYSKKEKQRNWDGSYALKTWQFDSLKALSTSQLGPSAFDPSSAVVYTVENDRVLYHDSEESDVVIDTKGDMFTAASAPSLCDEYPSQAAAQVVEVERDCFTDIDSTYGFTSANRFRKKSWRNDQSNTCEHSTEHRRRKAPESQRSDSLFTNALVSSLETKQRKWEEEAKRLIEQCEDVTQRKLRLWKEIQSTLENKTALQQQANQLMIDISKLKKEVFA